MPINARFKNQKEIQLIMKKIKVNEIFYSIQGEGANAGMSAVFVRLSGCNLQCSFCDTKHESYTEVTVEKLKHEVEKYNCKNIIWTGGEPTMQLTNDILELFENYFNCIETNGTNPVPSRIDYIACSPKMETKLPYVNEIRLPIKKGDKLPDISIMPKAQNYYISPIDVSKENIDYCLELIKENPQWKLSIQIHKLLKIA